MKSTTTRYTLPEHRIIYVGLEGRKARARAALLRKAGIDITFLKQRVTGSDLTDPNPWHYTVIAWGNWRSNSLKLTGV